MNSHLSPSDRANLKSMIGHTILLSDRNKNLTQEIALLMAESLTRFTTESIDKYITGQIEHGGDIRDRDLSRELRQEFIDTFWYQQASQWPKGKA